MGVEYICEPYNDTFRCFPKGQKQSSVVVNRPKSKLGTVAKTGAGVVVATWGCSGDPAAYYPVSYDAGRGENTSVTRSTDGEVAPDDMQVAPDLQVGAKICKSSGKYLNVPVPYPDIHSAMKAANTGDEIRVEKGEYYFTKQLKFKYCVSLIGGFGKPKIGEDGKNKDETTLIYKTSSCGSGVPAGILGANKARLKNVSAYALIYGGPMLVQAPIVRTDHGTMTVENNLYLSEIEVSGNATPIIKDNRSIGKISYDGNSGGLLEGNLFQVGFFANTSMNTFGGQSKPVVSGNTFEILGSLYYFSNPAILIFGQALPDFGSKGGNVFYNRSYFNAKNACALFYSPTMSNQTGNTINAANNYWESAANLEANGVFACSLYNKQSSQCGYAYTNPCGTYEQLLMAPSSSHVSTLYGSINFSKPKPY